MDFLENLKQEINQILGIERQEDESAQFGRENNGRKISPTEICGSRNVGLKNVIKIASDKKFKNCGADLSVNLKDLGTGASYFVKIARNKASEQEDSFIQEFQTNDALTMVNISLNRPKCFKQVLTELLKEHINWKNNKALHEPVLLLPFLKRKTQATEKRDKNTECFDDARVLVLTSHLKNILEANGHNCHMVSDISECSFDDSTRKLFPAIFSKINEDTKNSTQELISVRESVTKKCRQSPYRSHLQGTEGDVLGEEVELDFRRYLEENKINQGKNGFDKNLKTVTVIKADAEITDCLLATLQLENSLSEDDQNKEFSLLAVTPMKRNWETQISCLCWRMLTDHGNKHDKMAMCCCGPCETNFTTHIPKTDKEEVDSISFEEYLRLKSREIREAYKSRYGLEVQGKEWEQAILDVTIACIKFDMLLCPLRNKVSLKVNENSEHTSSSRDSIFVLYNYSRLCTLLKSYEKSVQEGTYPPLPDTEEIDFSSLREEQEWRIFTKYILYYPMLVDDLGRSLTEIESFQINPPTNKVCSFLLNLTRDLSSYYHQTKILLEPRPHLYPLMLARIYFVMALKQVMENAFNVIDVHPPTQM